MNLLTDPLIRVETAAGLRSMSLPALMAALGGDAVRHLTGIQCHQEDAFHVFLCSLAGAILARRGESEPFQSEAYWRDGLRTLAGDAGDDAWTLVVEDLLRPAFMQPPLPPADHQDLSPTAPTPDDLDLLPTARNHDVKQARALRPHPDEWIYALVSLQTMSGFFGRGNPGISRMNSGFGNRSIVELLHRQDPGGRWRDAVTRLLVHRKRVLAGEYGFIDDGLVLVWLEPWDGRTSLVISRLDPMYVEICRRVRLRGGVINTSAYSVPSESTRIAARELKGVVGDAWLPIDMGSAHGGRGEGERALTISSQGLTPEVLHRLVFSQGLQLGALHEPLETWKGDMWLRISVLVRGQGTTDGFHERDVLLPAPVRRRLFDSPTQRSALAQLSKTGIEYAGKMLNGVLKRAVFSYLQGAPQALELDDASAQRSWRRFAVRFDALWSQEFFNWLWTAPEDLESQRDGVLAEWACRLRDHALTVLREAEQALPQNTGRRYRVCVESERVFWASLYHSQNFPFLKEGRHEHLTGT